MLYLSVSADYNHGRCAREPRGIYSGETYPSQIFVDDANAWETYREDSGLLKLAASQKLADDSRHCNRAQEDGNRGLSTSRVYVCKLPLATASRALQ